MNPPEMPEGMSRVCIDFDGVLALNVWPRPEIGALIPEGVELAISYFEQGYEVVIYTARPKSHAPAIWKWCHENGLDDVIYDVICGKPAAGVYIDDRAWNPWPQTWADAETPDIPDEPEGKPRRAEVASHATKGKELPSPEAEKPTGDHWDVMN